MLAKIYRTLIRVGKIAGGATFIFGIFFGAYQFYAAKIEYFEVKREKRIEQSLSFFRQLNSDPFNRYRERFFKAFSKNKQLISDSAVDESKLLDAVTHVIRQEDVETEILFLFDFFDGVYSCSNKNICDRETTLLLFQDRANEIYILLYQYIEVHRKAVGDDFAVGLEKISKRRFD